jgi:uncharacterized membrane protein
LPGAGEVAGWTAAPILFTWIALTLSGLTLYRLARRFAGTQAALLAATLYLANPYLLFTAYERTAYAELLAAAWVPLLFDAILREKVTIPGVALPVGLLWLTNAPAAVMGSYTLALLATLRIVATYRTSARAAARCLDSQTWVSRQSVTLELALKTLGGTALGLGLAAFYIVPAAYERRFVQISMATIAGMRIDHNFLFEHTGTSPDALLHDSVLHTASLIAVILLTATSAALAATLIRRKPTSSVASFPALPLAILTAAIALLLIPWSAAIWSHAPQAAFLQFPWRLLAIVSPVFALAAASVLSRFPLKFAATAVAAVVLAAALTLPAARLFRQPCDPEDTAPARLALFHSNAGTDPTDEYTPTTADNDALQSNDPPYWLADSANAAAPSSTQFGPAPTHLALVAPRAEDLILNLRDYPAWRVSRNGERDPAREQRDDGLIAIPIPAGPSSIDIVYASTPDQTLGGAISLLAVPIFLFTLRRSRTL